MLKFAVHFSARITPRSRLRRSRIIPSTWVPSATRCCTSPARFRSDWIEQFATLSNTLACRHQRERDVRRMKGLSLAQPRPSDRKARPSRIPVLALWRQDHWRRLQPDRDRGADQALSERDRQGFAELRPAAQMKQMVAEVKPSACRPGPQQRRLHDRHCVGSRLRRPTRARPAYGINRNRARDDGASRPDSAHEEAQLSRAS